jgi:hypothetical protein
MRFREIVSEGYSDEIQDVIQDILVTLMTKDLDKIDTTKLLHMIAQEGYVISSDELVSILGEPAMQGFVATAGKDEITFNPVSAIDTSPEATVDVDSMAQNQAMDDIKADL